MPDVLMIAIMIFCILSIGVGIGFVWARESSPAPTVERRETELEVHMNEWVWDEGRVMTLLGPAELGDFGNYPRGGELKVVVERSGSQPWKIIEIRK